MKPLTLELEKGKKRSLHSIGWKTAREGEFQRQFYALDEGGKLLPHRHATLHLQFERNGEPVGTGQRINRRRSA